MGQDQAIVRTRGICKNFSSTKALIDVDIDLYAGEVLGLIGENGSGKSTLSTILAGTQKADSGTMYLDNLEYQPSGISDAMRHGISMVVQEQGTLNSISVAANIFAGKEQLFSKFGILDTARMIRETKALLDTIGVSHIAPDELVDRMSFEDRKLIEVARAESNKPRILLVDETTTALGKEGRSVMYNMINRMRDEGKSVIFISHDIDELLRICNRITVLRDGRVVGSLSGSDMQAGTMKKMMVGRDVPENMYRVDFDEYSPGAVALRGTNITHSLLQNVSIEARRGEILGIGGLTDCGMHELGKILFGLTRPDLGTVIAHETKAIRSAGDSIKQGIGYVSKNRDTESLMAAGSIKDNICLPLLSKLQKWGFISPRTELEIVKTWQDRLSIKMRNPNQYVMQLSGGNKQKVSIAKWLASDAGVFIFDCPTRGIDIGVKNDIYDLLYRLRNEGKAIVMISEELPELIGMSDRILILKDGRVNGTFLRNKELSEADLIEYMI